MCTRPIKLKDVEERVPCGFCLECRSTYARGWAVRCMHEAAMVDESCFVTLTYDDAHLPEHGSLVKDDFVNFMKRFRLSLNPRVKWRGKGWQCGPQPPLKRVRFYHVGEYGEARFRPHYHCLIFGHMFGELEVVGSKSGFPLYRSAPLEKLWTFGMSTVGSVSFASACYLSQYVIKRADLVGVKTRYSVDGVHEIAPEYSTMSRGGRSGRGLGYSWFKQYGEEVERLDSVVIEGSEVLPPRYYDNLVRERDEAAFELLKLRRKRKRERVVMDDELMARELIARKRLEMATRRVL